MKHKIHKVLVANRGEIVARVLDTAHKMGIKVVVLYTADDRDHHYLKLADEVVELRGETLADTFLNKEKIINIALAHKADAIHPGYGFLSENAEFAQLCESNGILWIGPSAESIRVMGYKKSAREFAERAGVPVLKAYYGTAEKLLLSSSDFHYPIMVKAQAGGGGKGMRIVSNSDDVEEALKKTEQEGAMLFGDGALFVEAYIEKARHIEVQLMGDKHGNVVHLYERDCTLQRRHQKIMEEAPAFGLSHELRENILAAAKKIAQAANYYSAGTVEFILDEKGNFYFLEMNTRIQVEHPVTELVVGIDVVKEQLLVAAGNRLSFVQDEVYCRGHALECRVYAEDPEMGFTPQNGTLTLNVAPEHSSVRVDGSFERTANMSTAYDPLVAKVITVGDTRLEAMKNMTRALKNYKIQGVKTNIGFLTNFLKSPVFSNYTYTTIYCDRFYHRHIDDLKPVGPHHAIAWYLVHISQMANTDNVWSSLTNWRHYSTYELKAEEKLFYISAYRKDKNAYMIAVNGHHYLCRFEVKNGYELLFTVDDYPIKVIWSKAGGGSYYLDLDGTTHKVFINTIKRKTSNQSRLSAERTVLSPLPGRVMRVYVEAGEKVAKGEAMLTIESMKIENRIVADHDSVIKTVLVKEGQQLEGNELMIELE